MRVGERKRIFRGDQKRGHVNKRPSTRYALQYSRDILITYDCKPRSHVSINDAKVAQKTVLNPRRLVFEGEPELHLFQAKLAAVP